MPGDSSSPVPATDRVAAPPSRLLPWFHLVFLALIALTGLAGGGLMWLSRQRVSVSPPPALPIYATLRTALTAPERLGSTVSTADLKGRVFTVAYTYSRCPRGCLGVVGTMLKLRDEFGSHPDFHQVTVAVGPEIDTPEALKLFAAASGVRESDRWWFLSGDRGPLRDFMTHQIGLVATIDTPPSERLSEFDLFEHDLRVALIDRQGRLRGYYEVQNSDLPTAQLHADRLRRDIRRLLEEK